MQYPFFCNCRLSGALLLLVAVFNNAEQTEKVKISIPIVNALNLYTLTVGIGSPPSPHALGIATGSANTFAGAINPFYPTSSTIDLQRPLLIPYGYGNVTGSLLSDTLTFNGPESTLTLPNVTIANVSKLIVSAEKALIGILNSGDHHGKWADELNLTHPWYLHTITGLRWLRWFTRTWIILRIIPPKPREYRRALDAYWDHVWPGSSCRSDVWGEPFSQLAFWEWILHSSRFRSLQSSSPPDILLRGSKIRFHSCLRAMRPIPMDSSPLEESMPVGTRVTSLGIRVALTSGFHHILTCSFVEPNILSIDRPQDLLSSEHWYLIFPCW